MGDLARHRPVALADLVQQRRAARVGQQLPAVADQAAGRHDELEPGAPIGIGAHLLQASLAGGHRLLHDADVVGRDVDRDPLVRLLPVALDHLGARDGQLEPLAPHLLDEDGQLELAASAHLVRVARIGRVDLDRRVAEHLAVEPCLDLAAGQERPVAPGHRRGVDAERHPQRRRIDVEARQRTRVGGIGQRVADRHLRQAGHAHDVARSRLADVDALDPMRGLQRGDRGDHRGGPPGLDAAIGVLRLLAHDRHALADLQRAVADPADRHAADVVVGGEVRDEQLERVVGLVGRRRGDLDEEVEQRAEVGAGSARSRVAVPALAFV